MEGDLKQKNFLWKDKYYFPQLTDVIVSNLFLFITSILLFVFFNQIGIRDFSSLLKGIVAGSANISSIVSGLLLMFFLTLVFLFSLWCLLVVIRTVSYLFLSEHLVIDENGLFLGRDKIIFSHQFDEFLFTSSGNFFLRKILFFRAILNYPFFKVRNFDSVYINFDQINSVSILKDSVFRSILRKWWSPAEDVYYLKVRTLNNNVYEKEIKDVYSFIKNDCLGFIKFKTHSELTAINIKWKRFENLTNIISAVIILIVVVFFILAYLKIYGRINFLPFIK